MQENHFKQSFLPIADAHIEILILGSVPGDKSLAENQYYAHPQNRFWKMLASITKQASPLNYEEKLALLHQYHIGLWDVIASAQRKGSLDSAIKEILPNDIDTFIIEHKSLKTIAFNGKKAEVVYDKYFSRKEGITYFSMPSTSPANAVMSLDDLCEKWKLLLDD